MGKQEIRIDNCKNCLHWHYIVLAKGICSNNEFITVPEAKIITHKLFYCQGFIYSSQKEKDDYDD